jgi:glycosyltransferase involved in cell wall biosynthesis
LADCARASALFGARRIEVIPYGLDLDRFKPIDQETAREKLSLPRGTPLIVYGGVASTADRRKGFRQLVAALHCLNGNATVRGAHVVVFGSPETDVGNDVGFPLRYRGTLHDDVTLALTYSAADVFVAPSLEDNLPNTVIEAMACGTPCVTFGIGGMPDLVEHGRTGYLAQADSHEDLAKGIAWVLEDPVRGRTLRANSRRKAEREFSLELQALRYKKLYAEAAGEA